MSKIFETDFEDPFDPTLPVQQPSIPLSNPEEQQFTVLDESVDYDYLDPTRMLQQVLGHVNQQQIHEALVQNNYQLDLALDALLDDRKDVPPAPKQGQVCRHFLLGQCYRSDCWFSHDPEMLVCKFYLRGTCYKGNECEFSHGDNIKKLLSHRLDDSKNQKSQNESLSMQNLSLDSSDDFPDLAKTNFPPLSTSTKQQAAKYGPSLRYEHNAFNAPKKEISFNNYPSSENNFPKIGQAPIPTNSVDLWTTSTYSKTVKTAPNLSLPTAQERYIQQKQKQITRNKEKINDTKWLSTGSNIEASYFSFREEAIQAAIQRNKLCQQYNVL